MKIAITGVTSGVGRRFAEMAIERGHTVRGLVRQPDRDDATALRKLGVDTVPGDILDRNSVRALCEEADAVVHMAALVGDWGPREQFDRINVGGTRVAIEAAADSGAERFVHLSSTSVYGRPEKGRITERWPTRIHGVPYDDSKTASERIAFELGKERGLGVAAVRPPVIYGPYDRNFMPRMLKMIRSGRMVLIDGGTAPMNVVWADHVVDVCLLCLDKQDAVGEAFNVMDTVDQRPPSVREVGETAARAAGLHPPSRSVPYLAATAIAQLVSSAFTLARSSKPPPLTPFVVKLMTLDVIYDSTKAVEKLGWRPQMDPLEGIAQFASAFDSR